MAAAPWVTTWSGFVTLARDKAWRISRTSSSRSSTNRITALSGERPGVIPEFAALLDHPASPLRQRLPENISDYEAEWTGSSVTTDHLPTLCEDVYQSLARVIEAEIARFAESDALDKEIADHAVFGQERAPDNRADARAQTEGHGIQIKVGPGNRIRTSEDGFSWQEGQAPTLSSLYDVAYGNHIFAAVGNEGAVVTSTDGLNWKLRDCGTEERLRAITFADGMFVAVGYEGTILASTDAAHWKRYDSGTHSRLQGICYGLGQFVVVGWDGIILTSTDGRLWKRQLSGISSQLTHVSFLDGMFVAFGKGGVVLTSTEGTVWRMGAAFAAR